MFKRKNLDPEIDFKSVTTKIYEKRLYFKKRRDGMYTLGSASYLDASKYSRDILSLSKEDIVKKLTKYNPILKETFSELLESIRCFFEREFGLECSYSSSLAYPGFHIFESSNENSNQYNHEPHFDGQYETLMKIMDIKDISPEKLLSFTLPIALPPEGGGLRMWNWNYNDNNGKTSKEIINGIKKSKIVNIKYNEGEIIWHNGLNLHQIKAWPISKQSTPRITMQGHGCLINNKMYLYW